MWLSQELFSLLLLDDFLHLFSLLPIVFLLEEKHICGLDVKVKSICELLCMLGRHLLQLGKLVLSFYDDLLDIH